MPKRTPIPLATPGVSLYRQEGARGHRFVACVRVPTVAGPKKQKWKTLRATSVRDAKAEARSTAVELVAEADAAIAEARAAEHRGAGDSDFDAWAAWWLEQQAPHLKPTYLATVRNDLDAWLVPYFGKRPIGSISRQDVEALQRHLLTQSKRRRGSKPMGPKRVNNLVGTLSSLLNYAAERGWLAANPCAKVKPIPVVERPHDWWTAEQTRTFLASVEGSPWRPLWAFLIGTGARLGEARGLLWRSVHSARGQVTIERNWPINAKEPTTPKTGRMRTLPLVPELVQLLEPMRGASNTLVFGEGERPFRYEAMRWAFTRATKAAGLPSIRLHDLRHSAASQVVSAGASLYEAQALLGHTSPKMSQRYAHLAPGALAGAAERLRAGLGGGGSRAVTVELPADLADAWDRIPEEDRAGILAAAISAYRS